MSIDQTAGPVTLEKTPETSDEPTPPLPWERQLDESSRQWAFFCEYRDCHPLERSLARVGRKLGVSTSFLERLSSQHRWVERTAASDQERDLRTRVRLSDQLEEIQRRHLEIADLTLSKISEQLKNLDPTDIGPQHLPKLWEMAARAQQTVFGESIEALPAEQMIRADELRSMLEEERMLDSEAESESAPDESEPDERERVQDWLDGRWPPP